MRHLTKFTQEVAFTKPQNLMKLKSFICIITATILFFIWSCEKSNTVSDASFAIENLTIDNYPKVDGSTSAHPLQVLIACKLLKMDYVWFQGLFDNIYRIWPKVDEPNDTSRFIVDSVVHHGTHQSYVNLIEGTADVIITAREPSDDEMQMAERLNVQLRATPIAIDAFVFIVNVHNVVSDLSVKEIQDIYTGKIKNWYDVGGYYSDIHPYQRNENSGSQELMETLVMQDIEMPYFPSMILYGMMGPINMISKNRNGLGYTVYFFERFMAPSDSLKLLAVEGIYPDYHSIKNREYVFNTNVYVVIREDLEPKSNAYKLYELLLTDAGQNLIKESGYIAYY